MASYAILNASESDLIKLNNATPVKNSLISIVSAGTGLGTSIAVPIKQKNGEYKYYVFQGEGGHIAFP